MPYTQPAAAPENHADSGAVPLFWANGEHDDAPVVWSPDLSDLVDRSDRRLVPDWTAWAQILAFGAPLAGRTPFEGIRRLQPDQELIPHDGGWRIAPRQWGWAQVEPDPAAEPEDLTGEVLDALRRSIRSIPGGPVHPMLSGGRDSRLLTALAAQEHRDSAVTAWTTSSDTGTSMEELVAARVARALEVDHRIVPARFDEFVADFRAYGQTVHYMASFHVWLMPVARRLAQRPGTIIDGLGGGVFLGGGFPDDPELELGAPTDVVIASRFARMARYLEAADDVLGPNLGQVLTQLCWEDFHQVAEPFAEHPNGATLTAYLARTLPGISMAPARVLATAQPTVMPIVDDAVVAAALSVPHSKKHDGVWYPHLLTQADSRLGKMPTAADLTLRRQHTRRGASHAAAQWYRELILHSPAEPLLAEQLRHGGPGEWSALLSKTKSQHLIRGLALLALWLDEYAPRLTETEPPFWKDINA